MNYMYKWHDLSNVINKTITKLKCSKAFPVKFDSLNIFVINMIKYLTALKLVSEKNGYEDKERQNFLNSIIRTFMSELQFGLTSMIREVLSIDSKKYDTFNKILEYIEKNKDTLSKTPLNLRLIESLNLFYDIKNLRNTGQHFSNEKVKKTEIKDRELAPYIHMEIDGSDLRISADIFEYIIRECKKFLLMISLLVKKFFY